MAASPVRPGAVAGATLIVAADPFLVTAREAWPFAAAPPAPRVDR